MDPIFTPFSFILGAIIGSFLNVVILRLPDEDDSIVFPPSRCPKCKALIRWFDNLPILSFLLLRGRCRSCGTSISLQYPVVELAMGLLSAALFHKFGISFEFFFYFVFTAALLAIIFIDIHHQIIPNEISIPGIPIGFAGAFFNPLVTWQDSLMGIVIGGGSLTLVAIGYKLLTKRDGLGVGDMKLLAMLGAFLGWQSILFIVFASSLSGSLVGISGMIFNKDQGWQSKIPYGPFLAVAALCYLFFREDILRAWQYYLTLSF